MLKSYHYYCLQMQSKDRQTEGIALLLRNFILGGFSSLVPEGIIIMIKWLYSLNPANQKILSYSFDNKKYVKSYVSSQAFQFALYDYLKRQTIPYNYPQHEFSYFLCGGITGFIASFLSYPFGYHQILLVNDIAQADKMKKMRASQKEIIAFRFKRLYKGFYLAGVETFMYRAIYFGFYDYLKEKDTSFNSRLLYCIMSHAFGRFLCLPIYNLRRDIVIKSAKSSDWKQYFLNKANTVLNLRGLSNSAALLIFDQLRQVYLLKKDKLM